MAQITYQEWIDQYIEDHDFCIIGLCHDATLKMKEAFPELIIQRGFINCKEHWWLTTELGEIVDPTVSQYYSFDKVIYAPFVSGMEVRIGKCMDCGTEIYDELESLDVPSKKDTSFCDEICKQQYISYLNERQK